MRGFKASDYRQPFYFPKPLAYLIPVFFFFFLTELIRIPYIIFSDHKSKLIEKREKKNLFSYTSKELHKNKS